MATDGRLDESRNGFKGCRMAPIVSLRSRTLVLLLAVIPLLGSHCLGACVLPLARSEAPANGAVPPCHSVPDQSEDTHESPCCSSASVVVQSAPSAYLSVRLARVDIHIAMSPTLTVGSRPAHPVRMASSSRPMTFSAPGLRTTVLRI